MPTRRTFILGAVCAPLALGRRASATDASALAFVTDIYSAYKGKDAKGPRSTTNAPSGAISSRRSRH
jgi:hypothetical protein